MKKRMSKINVDYKPQSNQPDTPHSFQALQED